MEIGYFEDIVISGKRYVDISEEGRFERVPGMCVAREGCFLGECEDVDCFIFGI